MADDPGLARLRSGALELVSRALCRENPAWAGLAPRLEEAAFAGAQAAAAAAGPGALRKTYTQTYDGLCRALGKPYGDFLEASLAAQLADGRVAPAEAATPEAFRAHEAPDPRQVGRAVVYAQLAKDPRFPEDQRRDLATRIEREVYNAAIARCEESEDSYRRQWDSPMFVNVYSERAGIVAANIDPAGTVAAACGGAGGGSRSTWALDRLAAGDWAPEDLGAMTAAQLCPPAGQTERELVAQRLEQKVTEKTSGLFCCPRCRARRHTYRQVQMKGADEPSTFLCTCKDCGERFEGHA